MKLFSQSVIEKLGYYVYILIDPRSNETFYIGKGQGNRIFSHLQCAIKFPNESDKIKTIKEIMNAGYRVQHYILRHGLTENVALEIESAIIDFVGLANLTNQLSGHKFLPLYLVQNNQQYLLTPNLP